MGANQYSSNNGQSFHSVIAEPSIIGLIGSRYVVYQISYDEIKKFTKNNFMCHQYLLFVYISFKMKIGGTNRHSIGNVITGF